MINIFVQIAWQSAEWSMSDAEMANSDYFSQICISLCKTNSLYPLKPPGTSHHVLKRTTMYLLAASSIVSPGWTLPPKPFHLPTPNPLFFIPSSTLPGWTTSTRVSSLGLNISPVWPEVKTLIYAMSDCVCLPPLATWVFRALLARFTSGKLPHLLFSCRVNIHTGQPPTVTTTCVYGKCRVW